MRTYVRHHNRHRPHQGISQETFTPKNRGSTARLLKLQNVKKLRNIWCKCGTWRSETRHKGRVSTPRIPNYLDFLDFPLTLPPKSGPLL
jgi:hypothetical protein